MENLELYAKIEPLLGIEDATDELHAYYLEELKHYQPQTLLDVGCGDGRFLRLVKEQGIVGAGIDLSQVMIDKAKAKGLSVACQDIKDAIGAYDIITSIFDVLNFLERQSLQDFLSNVSRLLKPGGYFLADINTLYGFSEVAQGVLTYDDADQSLMVDAEFIDNQLHTKLIYFEKEDELYQKSSSEISQHYHTIEEIIAVTDLDLQIEMPITLYGEEADKIILCFHKAPELL